MKNKFKKSLLLIFTFLIISIVNSTQVQASTLNNITFNSKFYAEHNSDLMLAFGYNDQALSSHYINYGIAEGRIASLYFDVNFYKESYGDLRQAFGNNNQAYYDHFVNFGINEGRIGSLVFDVNYYKKNYEDLKQAFGDNNQAYYEHFINFGINEGRASSLVFDVTVYKNYTDLRQAFGDNNQAYYEHFINFGINEGRLASSKFDVKSYINNYPDLQQAFGTNYKAATQHYIIWGKNEGRTVTAYGNKIISQKELSKYITRVAITPENWQDYFELEDIEDVTTNAFGETTYIDKYTVLNPTNENTYYSTSLEFELTNKNLSDDDLWDGNRKTILDFQKVTLGEYKPSFYFGVMINQSPDINKLSDLRLTINDMKVTRTTGYVYIFDIPDNLWNNRNGSKYLSIAIPDPEYDDVKTTIDYDYWIWDLGNLIDEGILKDLDL